MVLNYSTNKLPYNQLEKQQKRKESHNYVERKRRDQINNCIKELGDLLPQQLFEDSGLKLNKGTILENSVNYIKELQKLSMNLLIQNKHLLHQKTTEKEIAFLTPGYYQDNMVLCDINKFKYSTTSSSESNSPKLPPNDVSEFVLPPLNTTLLNKGYNSLPSINSFNF